MPRSPIKTSPAAQGYRMPAEWEPHEATWLSWPRREGISFPDAYDEVMPVFVQMVDALRESEQVRINVLDRDQEEAVRLLLKGIDTESRGVSSHPDQRTLVPRSWPNLY